jgi:hypothetical protein
VEVGSERKMSRRPSNASSAGSSMEEGYYLQASLQARKSERILVVRGDFLDGIHRCVHQNDRASESRKDELASRQCQ